MVDGDHDVYAANDNRNHCAADFHNDANADQQWFQRDRNADGADPGNNNRRHNTDDNGADNGRGNSFACACAENEHIAALVERIHDLQHGSSCHDAGIHSDGTDAHEFPERDYSYPADDAAYHRGCSKS